VNRTPVGDLEDFLPSGLVKVPLQLDFPFNEIYFAPRVFAILAVFRMDFLVP
jgi:hypothetical protein